MAAPLGLAAAAALGIALLAGCVEVDPAPRTGLFRKPTGLDNLPHGPNGRALDALPSGDAGSFENSGGPRGSSVLRLASGATLAVTDLGLIAPPRGLPAFSPDGSRLLIPLGGLPVDTPPGSGGAALAGRPDTFVRGGLSARRYRDDFILYTTPTSTGASRDSSEQQTADRVPGTASASSVRPVRDDGAASEAAAQMDAPIIGAQLRSFGHWGRVVAGVDGGAGAPDRSGAKLCAGFLSTFAIDGAPPRACVLTEGGDARVVNLGLAEGIGVEDWCTTNSGATLVIASAAGESPTLWLCQGERAEPLFSQGFLWPSGYVRFVTDGAGGLVIALRAAQDRSAVRAVADVLDIPARRVAYSVDLGPVGNGMSVTSAADAWLSTLACDAVALRHFDDGRVWLHGALARQAVRLPPQVRQISPIAPSAAMASVLTQEARLRGMVRAVESPSPSEQRWFIATGTGGCWFLRLSGWPDRPTLDAAVSIPPIGAVVCGFRPSGNRLGEDGGSVGVEGGGRPGEGIAMAGVGGLRSAQSRWNFGVARAKTEE